jgi:2-desacetyl-2-hydroxyethyl bacteriochlorophyllide A dehydrogenase
MKALQLQSVGNLELVDVPVPPIGDDELLVRTEAAVICTSDLTDIRSNPFGIALPVIMGHEAAGAVEAVGAKVKDFQTGDRVATHPVHPCFQCTSCNDGLAHLCENMGHFALNRQGTFAEYYPVRADRARRIPDHLDSAVAALAEPVAVCLEAIERARLKPGARLLVVGDGPFGVLIAKLALQRGVIEVVIAGHHDWRLAFAEGATQVNMKGAADRVQVLRDAGAGGYHAAIVAVSRADAYQQALSALRARGRVVVFSPVFGETPIDLAAIHMRELEIIGAVNDLNQFDAAVEMLSAPDSRLGEIVTHRFPFSDYEQAIALAEGGREEAMKVALEF